MIFWINYQNLKIHKIKSSILIFAIALKGTTIEREN